MWQIKKYGLKFLPFYSPQLLKGLCPFLLNLGEFYDGFDHQKKAEMT